MPDNERREISEQLAKIETKLDYILEQHKDHEERLRKIEAKPANTWEKVVGWAGSAIIGILAGYIISSFTGGA